MALQKKLTWKPKVKDQRGPEWKPRRCKHCKLMFVPADKNPYNAKTAKFCCKKCKDGFHRHGGMDADRLCQYIGGRILKSLLADEAFKDSLADKLRASSLGSMVRELAREEIKTAESGMLERAHDSMVAMVKERLASMHIGEIVDLDLETELEKAAKLQKPS